ncbi:hypothetical protein E4U12_004689 [Claviceps purpurea]|nr:hypothetical protein E4U12_004689 [Claviceps purpurea]
MGTSMSFMLAEARRQEAAAVTEQWIMDTPEGENWGIDTSSSEQGILLGVAKTTTKLFKKGRDNSTVLFG